MVYDPSWIGFDNFEFPRKDWRYSIYIQDGCELSENLLTNMPKPRGKGVVMMVYVDSDHAGDTVTRRSRTGFFIFLNSAPIYWISKNQKSCETGSFGSEFCAINQDTEYIMGLRYKLRVMGIPVDEPTFVYGNSQSVS